MWTVTTATNMINCVKERSGNETTPSLTLTSVPDYGQVIHAISNIPCDVSQHISKTKAWEFNITLQTCGVDIIALLVYTELLSCNFLPLMPHEGRIACLWISSGAWWVVRETRVGIGFIVSRNVCETFLWHHPLSYSGWKEWRLLINPTGITILMRYHRYW